MTVRWRICPLPAIAARVPRDGVVVDLGCGHGLLTQLLASPQREVIGVDADARKIAVARQTERPGLRFVTGDVTGLDLPRMNAVTIVDVLYLIPRPDQARILTRCAENMAPGGVILLKEMSERPRWKAWLNHAEETLAVRALKITHGSARFAFRPRSEWTALLSRLGFEVEVVPLDRGYVHPHVLFVARKRGA